FDAAAIARMKRDLFGRHLQTLEISGEGCDQLTSELTEFVRCVKTSERPRVSGEEGHVALELASRILDVIASHAWDGAAGTQIGPNAWGMPPALLFGTTEPGLAA